MQDDALDDSAVDVRVDPQVTHILNAADDVYTTFDATIGGGSTRRAYVLLRRKGDFWCTAVWERTAARQ